MTSDISYSTTECALAEDVIAATVKKMAELVNKHTGELMCEPPKRIVLRPKLNSVLTVQVTSWFKILTSQKLKTRIRPDPQLFDLPST